MTTPVTMMSTLESYLKLTTLREQTIAGNMANVDTPGYHTQDINFERELGRAMNASAGGPNSTAAYTPVLREVPGLMERPDGNNVSLDREGLLMSETQLQYQTGIQLIKREFHHLMSAINGGN